MNDTIIQKENTTIQDDSIAIPLKAIYAFAHSKPRGHRVLGILNRSNRTSKPLVIDKMILALEAFLLNDETIRFTHFRI